MKTYLTPEEFVNVFWTLMDDKLSRYNQAATTCDNIIWRLFQEYEKDVKETLEGSMYGIEEYENVENNANHLIGYQFHKSFRQVDVIPAKHIDGIIWSCIQDAPVFWKCMDKACKILVSEDLAENYKDEPEWL